MLSTEERIKIKEELKKLTNKELFYKLYDEYGWGMDSNGSKYDLGRWYLAKVRDDSGFINTSLVAGSGGGHGCLRVIKLYKATHINGDLGGSAIVTGSFLNNEEGMVLDEFVERRNKDIKSMVKAYIEFWEESSGDEWPYERS